MVPRVLGDQEMQERLKTSSGAYEPGSLWELWRVSCRRSATEWLIFLPFNKYFLKPYWVPGTALGADETTVNSTGRSPLLLTFGGGEAEGQPKK